MYGQDIADQPQARFPTAGYLPQMNGVKGDSSQETFLSQDGGSTAFD